MSWTRNDDPELTDDAQIPPSESGKNKGKGKDKGKSKGKNKNKSESHHRHHSSYSFWEEETKPTEIDEKSVEDTGDYIKIGSGSACVYVDYVAYAQAIDSLPRCSDEERNAL